MRSISNSPTARESPIVLGGVLLGALAVALGSALPYAGGWNDGSRLAAVEAIVDQHTVTIDNSLTTVPGQEVYQFTLANTLLAAQTIFQGLASVEGVLSVATAWGANAAMKPMRNPIIRSRWPISRTGS